MSGKRMKVYNLTENSQVYTSNVYLVTGSWNTMDDVNALVDVGRDLSILELIFQKPTGLGKKQVEKIVITHNHYDHTSMLSNVKKVFHSKVYAYSKSVEGVDRHLKDGDIIKLGDRSFEVIHISGHSTDSICLYNSDDGVIFSGDAPLVINTPESTYDETFKRSLEKLCRRNVRIIYPGHGKPITENCKGKLMNSLKNISCRLNPVTDEVNTF